MMGVGGGGEKEEGKKERRKEGRREGKISLLYLWHASSHILTVPVPVPVPIPSIQFSSPPAAPTRVLLPVLLSSPQHNTTQYLTTLLKT